MGPTSSRCASNIRLRGCGSVAFGEIWITGGDARINYGSPPLAAYSFGKKLFVLIITAMVGSILVIDLDQLGVDSSIIVCPNPSVFCGWSILCKNTSPKVKSEGCSI